MGFEGESVKHHLSPQCKCLECGVYIKYIVSFQALKEEDPKAALDSFQRVLDLENGEKGEWGFKVNIN